MTLRQRRRIAWAWLAAALLCFVLVRLPLLAVPLERDEGEYAYIAWRMLEGEVPYRDAFDQKPPGVFAPYLVALLLFGREGEGIRLVYALWSAASAALLFVLGRRLLGGLAAAGAVLVFCLASADPRLSAFSANTEGFLLLPVIGCVASVLRGLADARLRWWWLAGALGATGCWFKPVAATDALYAALLAGLALPAGSRARTLAARLAAFGAGALAVSAAVGAGFALAGAGAELVDAVWRHNLAYAGRRTAAEGFDNLVFQLTRQAPSLLPVWLLAGAALLRPALAGRRAWGLLAGWLLASCAGVAVGLQFRPHYFVQALPALALLAGAGLAGAVEAAGRRGGRAAAGAAVALALGVVAAPLLANREVLLAPSPEAAARRVWGLNPFPEAREIGRYIARTSAPDDTVFVVGSEPEILFHAGRRSATRYIFFYPLTGPYPDALERQREVIEEVRRRRPLYVVWAYVPTSLLLTDRTERTVFRETEAMLSSAYRLEFVVHPDASRQGYEFTHGAAAASWVEEHRARLGALPWLGVYRRSR